MSVHEWACLWAHSGRTEEGNEAMVAEKARLPRGIVECRGKYRVRVTWQGRRFEVGAYQALGDAKAVLSIAQSEVARGVFVPPAERRLILPSLSTRS